MNEEYKGVVIPAVYRNKKNGEAYHTLHTAYNATNSADNELMVVYYSKKHDMSFVREINEFKEKFEYVNE